MWIELAVRQFPPPVRPWNTFTIFMVGFLLEISASPEPLWPIITISSLKSTEYISASCPVPEIVFKMLDRHRNFHITFNGTGNSSFDQHRESWKSAYYPVRLLFPEQNHHNGMRSSRVFRLLPIVQTQQRILPFPILLQCFRHLQYQRYPEYLVL